MMIGSHTLDPDIVDIRHENSCFKMWVGGF